ncbi:MAG: hypothetical protein ABFS32_22495, partial [Bacteroidota bacterium]
MLKTIFFISVSIFLISHEEINSQQNKTSNKTIERPVEIEAITAPFEMPQLKKPKFPDKTFNIINYGAKSDGKTKNTKAFKAAIGACSA